MRRAAWASARRRRSTSRRSACWSRRCKPTATSTRTAKTIVVAKDQQTILIGGLMSDKTINMVQKIPLLGDIPIIGFFFRDTTHHVVKTNLIIAITPYVIADQTDLRRVLEKKM